MRVLQAVPFLNRLICPRGPWLHRWRYVASWAGPLTVGPAPVLFICINPRCEAEVLDVEEI